MAKVKFVAVVLLVAIASLGVAYAKTGTIGVDGMVQTGELQVDLEGTTIEYGDHLRVTRLSPDDRSVTFTVEGMYPGAEVTVHVKAVNMGSRSVSFGEAEMTWSEDATLKPYLQLKYGFQYDGDGNGTIDGGECYSSTWSELNNIAADLNSSPVLSSMVLRPGGSFYLGTPMDGAGGAYDYPLKIRLSPVAPNETQNRSVTFTLKLSWKEADCWDANEPVITGGIRIGAQGNGTQNFQVEIAKCINGRMTVTTVKDHIKKNEDYVNFSVMISGKEYQVQIARRTIEGFPRKNQ